jgi:NAD(P)-dependent dehydrogenase (short-subunit alcohol dehydrogenase family)
LTRRLEGKVAIVSGAGSVGPGWGNGRATAVRFAEEGARVFAVDRDGKGLAETLSLISKAGGTAEPHLCDVTDAKAVANMVAACLHAFQRIDILVNNVGGSASGGPAEMSEEVWDAQLDFNLKSVFLACKHVLPVMERQGGGAIVNIASTSALRWTGSAQVAYAAAKAGVIQLSRVVAAQHAAKGIRVNCIRRWWRRGSLPSAPAATCRPCCNPGWSGSRSASPATAATPRTRCCFSPRTRRASSPAPKLSSTAA